MQNIEHYLQAAIVVDTNHSIVARNRLAREMLGDDLTTIPIDLRTQAPQTDTHSHQSIAFHTHSHKFVARALTSEGSLTTYLIHAAGPADLKGDDLDEHYRNSTDQRTNLLKMAEKLAQIGFWHYNIQRDALYWSNEVFNIYGLDADSATPSLDEMFTLYDDDDREKIRSGFDNAISEHQSFELTARIARKDEKLRWVRCRASVELDDNGKACAIFGLSQDLTGEFENKETMERLSLVASRTTNGVMICDRDGRIEWVNRGFERLTGYSQSECLGCKPEALLHGPLTDDSVLDQARRTVINLQPVNVDLVNYHKNGEHYWVNLVATPIVQRGMLEGYIAIQTNISDRKKADSYIAQAQRMEAIGQLVGGVAHDFNNILGILRGNLELLELKLDESENKHLMKAFHACDRATGLTKKLLQFSRFKVTESKRINPNTIINNLADLLTKSLTQNVKLELDLQPEAYSVWGSSGDLEDSILNLVINARDAMEGNGKVVINTANVTLKDKLLFRSHNVNVAPGDYIRLSIRDTGPGIPEHIQARVFEPFFTTKEQGSGLGLSMVYGFVQRANGYILVDSGDTIGTEICIWLPRCDEEKRVIKKIDAPVERTIDRSFKIFVVDDEADILEIVSEYLSPLGCEIVTSSNPIEAQRILLEDKDIDILLTDEVMPGVVKGHTLVKTAIHSNTKIRCIIMSGYNLDLGQIVDKADVLAKPFTRGELLDMIKKNLPAATNQ